MEEVYGDNLKYNYGNRLDGEVIDNTLFQCMCKRLVTQLTSWYEKPAGEVGQRFTACLPEE